MQIAQWTIAVLMIALSLYIGVGQWWAIYSIPKKLNAQGQPRNYSMIPLIGGLFGTIGCLVAPSPFINRFWWVPPVIDPGCVLLFGCLAVFGSIAGIKRLLGVRSE